MIKPVFTIQGVTVFHADAADILPHVQGDAIITDPPYPNAFDHVWDILGNNAISAIKPGGFLVTFCGHYQVPRVIRAIEGGGMSWFWMCIATNNNQPIMHGYNAKCCFKPVMVFRNGKAKPISIFYDNFSLRLKTRQWEKSQRAHKWGQASGLFYEPIDKFTQPGDTVIDPFAGGGTTGVTCIHMGRKCVLIECDAANIPIIERRLREASTPLLDGLAS